MDRAAIKLEAKDKISSIRGSFVCVTLIIFATSLVISLAANAIGNNSGAEFLTSAFNLLVAPMLTIALSFFLVQGWRNRSPRTGDWMNAIFDRYGRKLGGYLWMALKIILWTLPFVAALMIYGVAVDFEGAVSQTPLADGIPFNFSYSAGSAAYTTKLYFRSDDAVKLIVPAIICIALYVTVIRVAYSYYFTTYILAACPNVMARDAVKLSVRMTKGYRWKIFVTELSFLGWALLSVLTLGILYLTYVGPYMGLTIAGIFDTLKEEGIREGRLTHADFGEEAPAQDSIEDGRQA